MRKIVKSRWTTATLLGIVSVLFSVPGFLTAQDTDAGQEQEVRELRQRSLQLDGKLMRTEKELETARGQLAEALLELKQLRAEVADLRVKAAHILVNRDDLHDARTLRSQLLDLQDLQAAHADLRRVLDAFGRDVTAAMMVLDREDQTGLRDRLKGRQLVVDRKLKAAEELVKTPETTRALLDHCKVLEVNGELGVIILTAGSQQGVRLGSVWTIRVNGEELQAKVLDVRPLLSAATVVKGNINQILPGAEAVRKAGQAEVTD